MLHPEEVHCVVQAATDRVCQSAVGELRSEEVTRSMHFAAQRAALFREELEHLPQRSGAALNRSLQSGGRAAFPGEVEPPAQWMEKGGIHVAP